MIPRPLLILFSFLLSANVFADAEILAGLTVEVVASSAAAEDSTHVTCLSHDLRRNQPEFEKALVRIEQDFPKAIIRDERFFCIEQSRVPSERLSALLPLLRRPEAIPEIAEEDSIFPPEGADAHHAAEVIGGPRFATPNPLVEPEARSPQRHYTLQNAGILAGGVIVAGGVVMLLPPEIAVWKQSEDPYRKLWSNFKRAWTSPPRWDRDAWYINYVGHPYTGMSTYLMERNRGENILRSFLFSTAASVAWEYAAESFFEQPSIGDLLITSTVGSLLGEANYRLTLRLRRNGFEKWEKVVVTILNPIYVAQNGYR